MPLIEILKKAAQDKTLWIAAALACGSLLISWPQVGDLDWQTIFSLASLMAVIQVYRRLNLLDISAAYLIKKAVDQRQLVQFILILTFIGSMFLTNDVGILTLVPLFAVIARQIKIAAVWPVVLINLAANLGSLVTPIGNPQNLFLLSHYQLNVFDFLRMALPISFFSVILLWYWSKKIPHQPLRLPKVAHLGFDLKKTLLAVLLTIPILLGILGTLPSWSMLLLAFILVVLIDFRLFAQIDYGLLLTFCCFFIAVGDFGRSAFIKQGLEQILSSQTASYLTGLGLSQLISNVPAVILLAPFTKDIYALFLGVNLGGLGTLVASLANLLAYKQYLLNFKPAHSSYLQVFLIVNLTSLLFLGVIGYLLLIWF
jgi:Na+/H+ antiporter NhaD/arsenite permease-like protein